jgi:hypothetical protein
LKVESHIILSSDTVSVKLFSVEITATRSDLGHHLRVDRLTFFWVGLYGCSAFGTGTDGRDFVNGRKRSSRISPSAPWGGAGSGDRSGLVIGILHLLKA